MPVHEIEHFIDLSRTYFINYSLAFTPSIHKTITGKIPQAMRYRRLVMAKPINNFTDATLFLAKHVQDIKAYISCQCSEEPALEDNDVS